MLDLFHHYITRKCLPAKLQSVILSALCHSLQRTATTERPSPLHTSCTNTQHWAHNSLSPYTAPSSQQPVSIHSTQLALHILTDTLQSFVSCRSTLRGMQTAAVCFSVVLSSRTLNYVCTVTANYKAFHLSNVRFAETLRKAAVIGCLVLRIR